MKLQTLLSCGPVRAADYPELRSAISRGVACGDAVRVLPGVYARSGDEQSWLVRAQAVGLSRPTAVVTGRAAAAASWWPELDVGEVSAAWPRNAVGGAGIRFEKRRIDADHVLTVNGLRVTCPALTALDLIPEMGGLVVDEVLRRRAASLRWLWHTLRSTPQRPGNLERLDVLKDSRDQPWSELEREAHRCLRKAGLKGWVSNFPVLIDDMRFFLDVAFPTLGLGLEFDGWTIHGTLEGFVHDRARDVALARAGWRILRFTSSTLDTMPSQVLAVIRHLRRARG